MNMTVCVSEGGVDARSALAGSYDCSISNIIITIIHKEFIIHKKTEMAISKVASLVCIPTNSVQRFLLPCTRTELLVFLVIAVLTEANQKSFNLNLPNGSGC